MTFEVEYTAYPSTKNRVHLNTWIKKIMCMLTYNSLSCTVQSTCMQKSTITLRNSAEGESESTTQLLTEGSKEPATDNACVGSNSWQNKAQETVL